MTLPDTLQSHQNTLAEGWEVPVTASSMQGSAASSLRILLECSPYVLAAGCQARSGRLLIMRWGAAWSSLVRLLFVIYCVEAGLFLVIAPWLEFWDLLVARSALSQAHLGPFLLLPWVRGAVSGFGLVHLIWGVHDLERLLLRPRRSEAPAAKSDRAA